MSRRTLLALGLLALTIACVGVVEQAVWGDAIFGTRYGEGAGRASYSLVGWAGMAGTLCAAALAIKVGPRATAIVGLGAAAVGIVLGMVGAHHSGSVVAPIGLGLFRVCPLGVAAVFIAEQHLGRLRFLALSAAAVAYSAASDASWLVGREVLELPTMKGAGIGVVALAALVLGAVCMFGSGRMSMEPATAMPRPDGPYRAPSATVDDPPAPAASAAHAVRGLLLFVLPVMLIVNVAYRVEVSYTVRGFGASAWVPQAMRLLVTLGAAWFFVVAVRRGERRSPLTAWAIAVVVFGVGLFVAQWAVHGSRDGIASFGVSMLAAVSTPLVWGIASSYAALSVPPRFATSMLALWSTGVNLVVWPLVLFTQGLDKGALLFVTSALSIGAGFTILRRTKQAQRALNETTEG